MSQAFLDSGRSLDPYLGTDGAPIGLATAHRVTSKQVGVQTWADPHAQAEFVRITKRFDLPDEADYRRNGYGLWRLKGSETHLNTPIAPLELLLVRDEMLNLSLLDKNENVYGTLRLDVPRRYFNYVTSSSPNNLRYLPSRQELQARSHSYEGVLATFFLAVRNLLRAVSDCPAKYPQKFSYGELLVLLEHNPLEARQLRFDLMKDLTTLRELLAYRRRQVAETPYR